MKNVEKLIQEEMHQFNNSSESLVFFSESVRSTETGHQLNIRNVLAENLSEMSQLDVEMIRGDLRQSGSVIHINKFFFSISHCPIGGGFWITNSPCGFDCESLSRINMDVVFRVSNGTDRWSEDVKMLWVAKESAFKCFSNYEYFNFGERRIKVLSEVSVTSKSIDVCNPNDKETSFRKIEFEATYLGYKAKGICFECQNMGLAFVSIPA